MLWQGKLQIMGGNRKVFLFQSGMQLNIFRRIAKMRDGEGKGRESDSGTSITRFLPNFEAKPYHITSYLSEVKDMTGERDSATAQGAEEIAVPNHGVLQSNHKHGSNRTWDTVLGEKG